MARYILQHCGMVLYSSLAHGAALRDALGCEDSNDSLYVDVGKKQQQQQQQQDKDSKT